jgi:hypothetical protein
MRSRLPRMPKPQAWWRAILAVSSGKIPVRMVQMPALTGGVDEGLEQSPADALSLPVGVDAYRVLDHSGPARPVRHVAGSYPAEDSVVIGVHKAEVRSMGGVPSWPGGRLGLEGGLAGGHARRRRWLRLRASRLQSWSGWSCWLSWLGSEEPGEQVSDTCVDVVDRVALLRRAVRLGRGASSWPTDVTTRRTTEMQLYPA